MRLRTKDEQKAYLDGYEMCAECIENYLTDEGKQKLECLLMAVRNAVGIETLEQEPKTEDWISVSERLPEKSVWVLAYCKTKDGYEYQAVLLLGKYNGEWTDCDDFCDEVIAWRPLPEPYKAESEAAEQ